MDQKFAGKPITAQYNQLPVQADLDQMTDTPTRRTHRRAQSETFFRFPDFDEDMLLDDVVADFNLDFSPAVPTLSSSSSDTYMNQPHQLKFRGSSDEPRPVNNLSHFRSLSVDADFFAGLDFGGDSGLDAADPVGGGGGIFGSRHRHSNSMDGCSTTSSFDAVDSTKKAMAPDKLAELALIDPKRAKRILANRQSAARSKERKTRYTGELERKVQTLQGEATTLSAQVTKLQRDTSGLTTENKELALCLQAMEQEAHLRDALNDALREELKHLKIAAGEVQVDNGNARLNPQFSSQRSPFNSFNIAQNQYVQRQQQELDRPRPTSSNTDPHGQLRPNFPGFNQRA